jgi:hypothetical protein
LLITPVRQSFQCDCQHKCMKYNERIKKRSVLFSIGD